MSSLRSMVVGIVIAAALGSAASAQMGAGDVHLLTDCAPAVRAADLVIEGVAGALLPPPSCIVVTVTSALKGELEAERIAVYLDKAPLGRRPKKGEARVLCLVARRDGELVTPAASPAEPAGPVEAAEATDGDDAIAVDENAAPPEPPAPLPAYELATYHASILPATEAARAVVVRCVDVEAPTVPGLRILAAPSAEGAPAEHTAPGVNPYMRAAAASDAILAGTLSGAGPEGDAGKDVVRKFTVEGAIFGYGAFREPITVRFPARGGEVATPPPGRWLLFLVGGRSGAGFDVVKHVSLHDPAREALVKRLALEAVGPRTARLTTIQATVAEWQDAWNARDAERCIRCYSRESRLRRRYASGGSARRDLERQMKRTPGTVRVSIRRIRMVLAPTSDGARKSAHVDVVVALTPLPGSTRDEHATMEFVHEKGEWLILREGF